MDVATGAALNVTAPPALPKFAPATVTLVPPAPTGEDAGEREEIEGTARHAAGAPPSHRAGEPGSQRRGTRTCIRHDD